MIAKALLSTRHPVLAHIIPMRRCNLSCSYCNEYDAVSKPVALETMFQRIDKLASLGTTIVTISGGEPLLHPELDDIIRHIRQHGMIAGLITNGYLLTADRIERLNRAGLEHLQISIDNVDPDEVSKKSLKVLDKKLQLLAEYAEFHVNINSVVGGGIHRPQDALVIGQRARQLGFTSTIGIIHDGDGQLQPLDPVERSVYHEMKKLEKGSYSRFNGFQDNIANGPPEQLALPRRRALSLHLRGRPGALLLAAARLPGQAADAVHPRRRPPRISHRKKLRAALHRVVRAPDFLPRFLPLPADHPAHSALARRGARPGPDPVGLVSSFRFPVSREFQFQHEN